MRDRRWLPVLGVLLMCLMPARPAAAQDGWKPFENFDFKHRVLTQAQLAPLSLLDLKDMRGLVFGRHGRVFGEAVIQDFLKTRPWYHPDPAYRVTVLNPAERRNMDAIKTAEWKKHRVVEPGDLRFYQNRVLTARELGTHSALEWQIMAAEIEAWRGKRFGGQPWLQGYFAERYWYHPDPAYSPRVLSVAERRNLATIRAAQKRQRHLALAPGDMGLFTDSPMAAPMLHGLSLYELRLLRNEVYARHGYRFQTAWLQTHFAGQSWYQPRLGPVALSPVEKRNVALIVAAETARHNDLSQKPVLPALLTGLSADDARRLRNEIYARHGKVFHDPWLQSYFRSQTWYHPDPHYSDHSLSHIERANAAAILAYENRGKQQLQTIAA